MYEASADIVGVGKDDEQEVEIKIQTQESPQQLASRSPSRAALEKPSQVNEESELETRKISCEDGLAKSATQSTKNLLSKMAPVESLEVRKITPDRKMKKKETAMI